MKRIRLGALTLMLFVPTALAAGVCSTGNYNSCVTCCKNNSTITNRPLCTSQCEDYKTGGMKGSVVRSEPEPGQIAAGAKILVDDGSCPAGQIKQVTGGSTYGGSSAQRTRHCVARH
jgi:hypothetical protein